MRKKVLIHAMMCSAIVLVMCSCAPENQEQDFAMTESIEASAEVVNINPPDISQIRSICELATLECYYHNVAKSVKEKGSGLLHIGEVERVFWIEYSGVAKLGIDMSKVAMELDGDQVRITIPKAALLGLSDYSFTEDSYISSDDGLNKNPITAENQTEAVAAANEDIRKLFESDHTMLMRAQDRAKKLIENYINQLSELSGRDYKIEWIYENDNMEDR
ncbi:MAG: DUF4230 domain-containing protein [Lachnospiraceae bacterium]|nr:DUF4230 domain-containing protein [Lachnospiraceae bacterium]